MENKEIKEQMESIMCNIIDLSEDGHGILYFDYDSETNELYAGYATNVGIPKNFVIQYDKDFSFDENLQALVETIYNS
jgi:hypothetical protein